jgi:hypothetical protein
MYLDLLEYLLTTVLLNVFTIIKYTWFLCVLIMLNIYLLSIFAWCGLVCLICA